MTASKLCAAASLTLALAHACAAQVVGPPVVVHPDEDPSGRAHFWLESSLHRVYPATEPGCRGPFDLLAPRNGRVSFQACARNDRPFPFRVECEVDAQPGLEVQVRRVGYVPVRFLSSDTPTEELEGLPHIPGYVPDPLFPDQVADVSPYESMAFWITVRVPTGTPPGLYRLTVRLLFHGRTQQVELPATVEVAALTVEPRRDFPVTHWWRAECICDWYGTGMMEDERWWELARRYIEDLVGHGTNVIYVPSFFMRRETFERPAQLLIVTQPEPGIYNFDFTHVRRFVQMARECGAEYFEWPHLWIYWGVVNPIRVYEWVDGRAVMLWPPETDGHGELYHGFLRQFLPEFRAFLEDEGILDQSFFHLSDEPSAEHIPNYLRARGFLREVAPWMRVMDALSDIEYGRQGLTDIPIPIIASAQAYIDEGIPHWVYFCCAPRGPFLQRLVDTPLAKIRMSGWLFYRLRADGFLHWGYNYWHAMEQERIVNPFERSDAEGWAGIPPGDPFVVYPGPDGPMDSIRWEVFAESLQDYAILQSAGIDPDAELLADITSYSEFPKSPEWIRGALRAVLATR